jgi:threonine/homoserine/homoserine lactone efflux protein
MFETVNLTMFIVSGLLLNITPGADVLYITSRSASQGTRAGVVAALGIGTGGFVHILFATFGLSAILATSAVAFTMVKLTGAGYLVYLGITTLLALRTKPAATAATSAPPLLTNGRIFRQAILVNILNPKVALFFLAFLPQFVAPHAAQPPIAFLFLGCLFNLNGTIVNILFAVSSAQIAGRVKKGNYLPTLLNTGVGALFIWLGLRLAFSAQR